MNTLCKRETKKLLAEYCDTDKVLQVADFGSYDTNGTYRKVFPEKWKYTGYDIVEGPNVDVVMDAQFNSFAANNSFDVVICGSTLEHCTEPFRLVAEMARVLVPGGTLIINAPSSKPEHGSRIFLGSHYRDYWRFLPQGVELLIERAGLKVLSVYVLKNKRRKYIIGVGTKEFRNDI